MTQNEGSPIHDGSIVITGAGGGIGLAVTNYFLSKNITNIVCHYRNRHESLFNVFKQYGHDPEAFCYQGDLSIESDVDKFKEFVNSKNSKIWAIINIAGASTNKMSWKLTKAEFQQIIDSNLLSVFLCCKAFIPSMRGNLGGRIINFSSVVAFTGAVGASHYCAAKAGILGFTKTLSLELANKNITANSIALGYFNAGLIQDVPEELKLKIQSKA